MYVVRSEGEMTQALFTLTGRKILVMTGAGISTGKCWVSFKWKVWQGGDNNNTKENFQLENSSCPHVCNRELPSRTLIGTLGFFLIFALFKLIVVCFFYLHIS